MTIRIWTRAGNYPNKHTGIYQDATADPYEDVKFFQGQRVDLDHEIKFLFKTSLLRDLAKLGCLWTNINPPLVNGIIGELLSQHASSDVQLLRAHIFANDGETLDYYLVNIMSLVHCLDYEKSIIDSFWDDGRPRGISKLRFKSDACMNGHAIARLEEYHTTQLVSEDLYQALSKLKYKGLHFELDSDGDGYRF
jgi:hypothetical protein